MLTLAESGCDELHKQLCDAVDGLGDLVPMRDVSKFPSEVPVYEATLELVRRARGAGRTPKGLLITIGPSSSEDVHGLGPIQDRLKQAVKKLQPVEAAA